MDYDSYCIDLLSKLVSIPSESQNEESIARFLYSWLGDMGMDVKLRRIEGKSYNITANLKYRNNNSSKKLILGGHIDTVAASDDWNTNPYILTENGDYLYGLGAGDMKGGLAAQITVLKKILDSSKNCCEIEFVGLADEERHSVGAHAYAEEAKKSKIADFAIFAEPHYDNIVIAATGKILLKLSVFGKTGHAAFPESGVNAIDCISEFLTIINKKYMSLYKDKKTSSMCVIEISSGNKGYSLNIPSSCYAYLNKQIFIEENAEDFINDLKKLYNEHIGIGNLTVTREIPYYLPYQIESNEKNLQRLLSTIQTFGCKKPMLRINQSVSDVNVLYNELKIPSILYGPQGVNFHKENEYVAKSSIFSYIDILEEFICSF